MVQGIVRYSTGAKFQGNFDEDMNFQNGLFIYNDGDFIRGEWEEGIINRGSFWKINNQKMYPLMEGENLIVFDSIEDKLKVSQMQNWVNFRAQEKGKFRIWQIKITFSKGEF